MSAYAAPALAPARRTLSLATAPTTNAYCAVPQRLIVDLRDNPIAIGLYALISRLYLIVQAPVPLSRADVIHYDPTLKTGAVKRAFDRLTSGGWLIEPPQAGRRKHRYTPAWGLIKGNPLPWRLDQPCYGRPRHIARLPLDRALFDVCMGKLTPHPTQTAIADRYVTSPVLTLADIGCYAITLAGIPRETPALQALGLVRDRQALPLPPEQQLLALISQRPLTLDGGADGRDTELTTRGTRRLGIVALSPRRAANDRSQPLFFVPPKSIGSSIGPLIGCMIGSNTTGQQTLTAATSSKARTSERSARITWDSGDQKDLENSPLAPQVELGSRKGGGAKYRERQNRRAARQERPSIPDTEATRLLKTINVLPAQLIELADVPIDIVKAAIADGQAREGIRDLAGWVVTLLRTHRSYGWKITPPPPRVDSPEALREAFTRYTAQQAIEHCEDQADEQPKFPTPPPAMLDVPGTLTWLWSEVQASLRLQLSRREFDTWIRRAALRDIDRGVAAIVVPNTLVKEAIESRYLSALRALLIAHVGAPLEVRITLSGGAAAHVPGASPAPHPSVLPPAGVASSTPAAGTGVPDPESCPDWIALERWRGLPAMLRAALVGSTFVSGEVQIISPYLDRLLRTRYTRELADLIAVAQAPVSAVEQRGEARASSSVRAYHRSPAWHADTSSEQ